MIEKINSAISPLERDQKINEIIDKLPSVGHNLFDIKWSDHLLNDQSWLLSNGSWCSGTTYSGCYQHLVDDIDDITAETETIAGYTVTFYRADDEHKICLADQETTVNDIYTATGLAWYYILDTTNTRFKLPRSQWGFVGYRNGVGNYIAPALPNITATFLAEGYTGWAGSDAVSMTQLNTGAKFNSGGQFGAFEYYFNAHDSNSIYQNNATVQPPATQMYLYFYVGEFSQTATEQTAGLNSQLFNGKADTDLGNMTNAAKIRVAHNSKPSTSYENLTLGASGATYTAPADGLYWLAITASGVSNYTLTNSTKAIGMGNVCNGNGYVTQLFVPAAKGDTVTVTYQLAPSSYSFYFIYDNGSESEAQ